SERDGDEFEEDLREACGLAAAAEAEVVGERFLQRKPRADPATLFGSGKVDEIKLEIDRVHPDAIVVDNDLTPAQGRNLEKAWGVRVIDRSELFTVGLVGYTNAGKSTLLNALTGSNELVADMLFATLDTRTRQWRFSDGRVVLLSDTVGFLQRLPHHLVASFHATLEETLH